MEIMELAELVAREMGADWTAAQHFDFAAKISRGADGPGVYVSRPHNLPGRVAVGCAWPSLNGRSFTRTDAPVITVAESRGPAAIAAEITRRLIPAYLPLYAAALADRDRFVAERSAAECAAAEIAGEMATTAHQTFGSDSDWIIHHNPTGATFIVRPTGECVRVKMDITHAQAIRLSRFLATTEK